MLFIMIWIILSRNNRWIIHNNLLSIFTTNYKKGKEILRWYRRWLIVEESSSHEIIIIIVIVCSWVAVICSWVVIVLKMINFVIFCNSIYIAHTLTSSSMRSRALTFAAGVFFFALSPFSSFCFSSSKLSTDVFTFLMFIDDTAMGEIKWRHSKGS